MHPPQSRQTPVVPQDLLREMESERNQIHQIKHQRSLIASLRQNSVDKEAQIEYLTTSLSKCQHYRQKYSLLRAQHHDCSVILNQRTLENDFLKKSLTELMGELTRLRDELQKSELDRSELIRERHRIEEFNREIEHTFREYQAAGRSKEKAMRGQLQQAEAKLKQLREQSQANQAVFENERLRGKSNEEQTGLDENEHKKEYLRKVMKNGRAEGSASRDEAGEQNERLKAIIRQKQQELQRWRLLNHQLSLEFDKSVRKICDFEKELSQYRRENHELKKALTMFVEGEQQEKHHLRRIDHSSSEQVEGDQDNEQQGDDSSDVIESARL